MNYFDIKFFHIMLTILYVFGLMTASYNPKLKLAKFFYFFVTIMLLLSGVLATDKLGLALERDLPLWLMAKLICWVLLLGIVPLVLKKYPQQASKLNCLFVSIALIATYLGVHKP